MDKNHITMAAKALKLRSISLYESELKRFADLDEDRETLGQQNKVSVKREIGEGRESERVFSVFRVRVELGSRIIEIIEQTLAPLFHIEATFQVDYEMTEEVSDEALAEFARFNVVHNVWPFWRQHVFSTAQQADLPCPDVPLYTDCLES